MSERSDECVSVKGGDELSAAEVYAIWQIRDVVFAVEQRCDVTDPDGIDLLPATTHVWLADDHGLTSYLRTYVAGGFRRIGRVATRRDVRGRGLSTQLLRIVHERWDGEEIRLGAQAHLERWYESFGYRRCGENYIEAGIDHVPMRRPAPRP